MNKHTHSRFTQWLGASLVLITAWLAPQILAQLQQPSSAGWAVLAGVLGLVLLGTWALKRWARQL